MKKKYYICHDSHYAVWGIGRDVISAKKDARKHIDLEWGCDIDDLDKPDMRYLKSKECSKQMFESVKRGKRGSNTENWEVYDGMARFDDEITNIKYNATLNKSDLLTLEDFQALPLSTKLDVLFVLHQGLRRDYEYNP